MKLPSFIAVRRRLCQGVKCNDKLHRSCSAVLHSCRSGYADCSGVRSGAMVWTRPRDVGCQPRKTGLMKLLSSIAAREGRYQGVQGGRSPVLRVPCWTKELISSSYDGGRSGRRRCPVAPSCVCTCAADHVTTSRPRARTITGSFLARQTAYPCNRPPAPRARVAPHPSSSIPPSCSSHE